MTDLTVREAGRLGGRATLAKFGPAHFSALAAKSPHPPHEQARRGKRGGEATWERHGESHYRAIGRAGGEKTRLMFGREHFVEAGRKGGAARRRGPEEST